MPHTNWYTRRKVTPLWKSAAERALKNNDEMAQANRNDGSKANAYKSLPVLSDDEPADDKPFQDTNIQARPYMELLDGINTLTSRIMAHGPAVALRPDDVEEVGQMMVDFQRKNKGEYADDGLNVGVNSAAEHLGELMALLEDDGTPEELYEAWWAVTLHLRDASPDYDQYVLMLPSPDEVFATHLPQGGELDKVVYGDLSQGQPVADSKLREVNPAQWLIQVARKSAGPHNAIKHSLSSRQITNAFKRLVALINNAGGGWVLANPIFSGLSLMEIDALVEEGLAVYDNSGGRITLSRMGQQNPLFAQPTVISTRPEPAPKRR